MFASTARPLRRSSLLTLISVSCMWLAWPAVAAQDDAGGAIGPASEGGANRGRLGGSSNFGGEVGDGYGTGFGRGAAGYDLALTPQQQREQIMAALEQTKAKMVQYQEQLTVARQRAAELEEQAAQALARIEAAGLSPQAIEPVLQTLIIHKLEYELDLHGKEARREAIVKLIAETGQNDRAEMSKTEQLLLKEHESLLKAAHAELRSMQQLRNRGAVTEDDVVQAREKVAQAEIRFELKRAEIDQRGQAAVEPLTTELRDLSIDTTELRARHGFVVERLKQYQDMPAVRERYLRLTGNEIPAAGLAVQRLHQRIGVQQERAAQLTLELKQLQVLERLKEQLRQEEQQRRRNEGAPGASPQREDGM